MSVSGVIQSWGCCALALPSQNPHEHPSSTLKQFHVIKHIIRRQILVGVFVQVCRPAFCGTETEKWGWDMHPLGGFSGQCWPGVCGTNPSRARKESGASPSWSN